MIRKFRSISSATSIRYIRSGWMSSITWRCHYLYCLPSSASPDQIIIRSYRFGRYILFDVECFRLKPMLFTPSPVSFQFFANSRRRAHIYASELHDCKWPLSKICRYIKQRIQLPSERTWKWLSIPRRDSVIWWGLAAKMRRMRFQWYTYVFSQEIGVKLLWHWTGHFLVIGEAAA